MRAGTRQAGVSTKVLEMRVRLGILGEKKSLQKEAFLHSRHVAHLDSSGLDGVGCARGDDGSVQGWPWGSERVAVVTKYGSEREESIDKE